MKNKKLIFLFGITAILSGCVTVPGETVVRDSKILKAVSRDITADSGTEYKTASIAFKRLGSVSVLVANPKVKSIRKAKTRQSEYLAIADAEAARLCLSVRKRSKLRNLKPNARFIKKNGKVTLVRRKYC